MQAIIFIRRSDMKPVLECWSHELNGLIAKPEYMAVTTLEWLQGFNKAVNLANGNQPSAELIRAQF